MFLFLDDVRPAPPGSVLCRTAADAIALIDSGVVQMISFDHDLGGRLTGYDVAKRIELLVSEGRIRCPDWAIHSANPVGRGNIEAAMLAAMRFERQARPPAED